MAHWPVQGLSTRRSKQVRNRHAAVQSFDKPHRGPMLVVCTLHVYVSLLAAFLSNCRHGGSPEKRTAEIDKEDAPSDEHDVTRCSSNIL